MYEKRTRRASHLLRSDDSRSRCRLDMGCIAAAAMSFFGSVGGLHEFLKANGNNAAFGGLLAIIGVIAAPITSGETAFRSARLIVADFINYSQKKLSHLLMSSGGILPGRTNH